MKLLKIFGISLLSLLLVVCLGINVWYLVILNQPEKKVVTTTYKIGLQDKVEDTNGDGVVDDSDEIVDSKPFIEVIYNTNDAKNGKEFFEVKFNYFMDETGTDYYFQSLQFVGDYNNSGLSVEELLNHYAWELSDSSTWKNEYSHAQKNFLITQHYWNAYVFGRENREYGVFNNAGTDGAPVGSFAPLSSNTRFNIQIDNAVYEVGFDSTHMPDSYHSTGVTRQFDTFDYINIYYLNDPYYLARQIYYNIVSRYSNGTHSVKFVELLNQFTFTKDGKTIFGEEYDLVSERVASYLGMEIKVNESGAQTSSDTISGILGDSTNTNYSEEDIAVKDYFYGRVNLFLTEKDFDIVMNNNGSNPIFKIKESARNELVKYLDVSDLIDLHITFDLSKDFEWSVQGRVVYDEIFEAYGLIDRGLICDVLTKAGSDSADIITWPSMRIVRKDGGSYVS